MKITNTGTTPDRLTGGTTEAAKKFEIHEMKMEGAVMKMRELPNGLEIPPGATVELKPGSYHIMMTTLAKPFAKGDRVKASLTFEKAGKVDIEFAVDAARRRRRERAQALSANAGRAAAAVQMRAARAQIAQGSWRAQRHPVAELARPLHASSPSWQSFDPARDVAPHGGNDATHL